MDQKDEIKAKVDLVEVIATYLPLKKAGRNFAALCPFHSEKTPSFMVSSERQAWKCFGCGEGGDVFTFLEKIEGWEFREALEEMAKRVGVDLRGFGGSRAASDKEKLIAINSKAAQFYQYLLEKHKVGEVARQYLKRRGIPQNLWQKFDLGFAPAGWENLLSFLQKRGVAIAEAAAAGLVVGREGRVGAYYDRFRNRLMFPLKDSRGKVLGFAGRLLDEGVKEAKYVNSPQTAIFNKGSLLFGLDVARGAIRQKNEAILVEGEFDVLSLQKVGVDNVVASKGTALTEQQVAILSRICDKVVICFDADIAGDAAARRGIELLDFAGVSVGVARLGNFKDPDEFAQKDPKGMRAAIVGAQDIYDYFIDSARARFDPTTALGKKKIGAQVIPVLAKIADDLVRAHYIGKLAKLLDLETALVAEAVAKKTPNFYVEGESITSEKPGRVAIGGEQYFLALLVFGDGVPLEILAIVEPGDFEQRGAGRFWSFLRDIMKRSKEQKISRSLSKLDGDLKAYVDELYLVNINPDFGDRELWALEVAKVAKMIKRASLKRQLELISHKLKEAQVKSDEKEISGLLSKFKQVSGDIKKMVSN